MARSLVAKEDLNEILRIETINLENKNEDGFICLMNACEIALRKYCRELQDLIRIYDENCKKFETSQEEFIANKIIGTSSITIGAIAGFGAVGFGIPGIVVGLVPSIAGGYINYKSTVDFDKVKNQIIQELSEEPENKLEAETELKQIAEQLSKYLNEFEIDESRKKKLEGMKYKQVDYQPIQYNHSLFGDNKFINNNIGKFFTVLKNIDDKTAMILKMYTRIEKSLPNFVSESAKFAGRNLNKLAITGMFMFIITKFTCYYRYFYVYYSKICLLLQICLC